MDREHASSVRATERSNLSAGQSREIYFVDSHNILDFANALLHFIEEAADASTASFYGPSVSEGHVRIWFQQKFFSFENGTVS